MIGEGKPLDIVYQVLGPDQAAQYREVRLEALQTYPECFGSRYEDQVGLEKLYFERLIEEQGSSGFMMAALSAGHIVGICGLTYETDLLAPSAELIQMYVRPSYQGLAIGRGLVNRTLEKVAQDGKVKRVALEVGIQNGAAAALYARQGFIVNFDVAASEGNVAMSITI